MADKPTTTDVSTGAINVTVLNNNFAVLEDAIEDCLGRGGTSESPNSMEGDLDMDTNKIINVANPTTSYDVANKEYVDSAVIAAANLGGSGLDSLPFIDLSAYGGVGDGVTNNDAAILAAQTVAGDDSIFVPVGDFLTTLSVSTLTGNFIGAGNIVTTDSSVERTRAKTIVHIDSESSDTSGGNNIVTGFDSNYKTNLTTEVLVTGTDTAGDPALSYVGEGNYTIVNEVSGSRKISYYDSGKNKSPFNTGGRTGWFSDSRQLTHAGKGDCWELISNVFNIGSDPSIIKTHGSPAAGQHSGKTTAGADDVIIQNLELTLDDGGYDVVGKGMTCNLIRGNSTAAKEQFWYGGRFQSVGTEKPDAGFQLIGDWKNGIDLSVAGDIDRAVSLKEGQGIFFDAVPIRIYGAMRWITSTAVSIGDLREYEGNVYEAAGSGTTGATPPTHTSGTVSDGAVDWIWVSNHNLWGYANTSSGTKIYKDVSGNLIIVYESTTKVSYGTSTTTHYGTQVFADNIRPEVDNTRTLGASSFRWGVGYISLIRTGNGTTIWTSGGGSPEGSVTAVVGSLYTRTNGGAGTTLYVKESGTGNTGWVAK